MSEDLIKRTDAIKALHEEWNGGWLEATGEWVADNCEAVLNRLPSADRPQGEWIPCSERLPSEDEQDPELGVIVTLGNGYSGLQYDWYHDGHWYDWDGFVVAWMSLPKPWKGESNAKEA